MNGSSWSRNGCSGRGRFFCPKVRWQKPCEIPSGDPCDFLRDQDWKSWGSKTTDSALHVSNYSATRREMGSGNSSLF